MLYTKILSEFVTNVARENFLKYGCLVTDAKLVFCTVIYTGPHTTIFSSLSAEPK